MPDTEATPEDPLAVEARLRLEERYTPRWPRMLSPVQTFVGLLPSFKDTRTGRKTAQQVKLVAFGVSGAVMIFGGALTWVVVGAVLMTLSLVIPLPEGRKRSILSRLKSLRSERTRVVERPGRLVYDGRRLILEKNDEKLRRVLVDRGSHRIEAGRFDGAAALKIEPESGRKAESIWMVCEEAAPPDDGPRWGLADVDHPAIVGKEGFEELRKAVAG